MFSYEMIEPYIVVIFTALIAGIGFLIKNKFFSNTSTAKNTKIGTKSETSEISPFDITDRNQAQTELNQESSARLKMIEKRLEETIIEFKHLFKDEHEHLKLFKESQKTWIKYRDAQARIEEERYSGGTIQPLIYPQSLIKIIEKRIKEIKELSKE